MLEDYEEFTEEERKILENFVTNTAGNVFALKNLPEVIKGALFSKYSRSRLGLRSLLLKDFIFNEDEAAFQSIIGHAFDGPLEFSEQTTAIKKAQNFYDRILDGYGDDSIGELGGAHLAVENVSMIAAKTIEDCRIGGSPLEKSTRYVYFDQKVGDQYLYYQDPILMTSAFKDLYVEVCDFLFATYSKLIPILSEKMEKENPIQPEVSNAAYKAAIRAQVLDCLRGILPAGTVTNLGVYGNGRFFESMVQKLHSSNLAELQEVGRKAQTELSKVIPSFIRRADPLHKHYQEYSLYAEQLNNGIKKIVEKNLGHKEEFSKKEAFTEVRLVEYDPEAPLKVLSALMFAQNNHSLHDIEAFCRELTPEQVENIFEIVASPRENRRHKSPRALERAFYTFEFLADYGVYRDLHRHRMLTQERQLLTCNYGYYIPKEIIGTGIEDIYLEAMDKAKKAYDTIAKEFPEEAQYVVPMAYRIRWYFNVNLRALQWLCELRSSPQGHVNYRFVVQEMAKQVFQVHPQFEKFFKYVNFDGFSLGRLDQEQKSFEKSLKKVF